MRFTQHFLRIRQETLWHCVSFGDPGTIRTFDPQLRRLLLYPLSYGAISLKELKMITLSWWRREKIFANITEIFCDFKK